MEETPSNYNFVNQRFDNLNPPDLDQIEKIVEESGSYLSSNSKPGGADFSYDNINLPEKKIVRKSKPRMELRNVLVEPDQRI